MSVYFKRLPIGYPGEVKPPDDWPGSWKIYTVCASSDPRSCTTRSDVGDLDIGDKKDARLTFVSFTNKAATGEPLTNLYDEKQCHETHSFDFDGREIKIFRIWGAGKIRVNFCYLPDERMSIAIVKTWAKRKDKLSDGEKAQLEHLARQVFECLKANSFDSRVI
jgi:hypothetical protein